MGSNDSEEGEEEFEEDSEPAKNQDMAQGPTVFQEKLSLLLVKPFSSLPKLCGEYWSLYHSLESLRVFKALDYICNLIISSKCP